ncbi:GTPase [Vibrio ishigakensis]|uniref:GTPase n=1 Tax=Vibrio ishigakensis TaxID=1481914 RepID=A0A0B8P8T8_9VIBR|nr:GTPase [Vibrio ishigakensis]
MFLDYVALGLLIFVALVIFYGIIVIHDIPYEIAHKRNHPHQDAIHVTGWISLFTLHALWPFLWIWATLWREDRGWGMTQIKQEQSDLHHDITQLNLKVAELSQQVADLQKQKEEPKPVVVAEEKKETKEGDE